MSENRENSAPGDPVEEETTTQTEVLEAARRATGGDPVEAAELPEPESVQSDSDAAEEQRRREAVAAIDTQVDIPAVQGERAVIAELVELPSAAPDPAQSPAHAAASRVPRDGEVPVESVDQLAALYMQTPLPPELKGNRGAGTLIALLATFVFALVYAGGIALLVAWEYPASTFVDEGLLPRLLTIGFAAAVISFFVAQLVLVLIFGKAGWWLYVLGGFFVAVFVWLATFIGMALQDRFVGGETVDWGIGALFADYAFAYAALVAAVIAREISLWFGVWIGARGRKVRLRNAETLAEYENTLAGVSQQKV